MKCFLRPEGSTDDQLAFPTEALFRKRIVILDGVIGDSLTGFGYEMLDLLLALDTEAHEPIKLIIDSPGGITSVGFMLYDTIKTLYSPVYTIGRNCNSMAAIIMAAGEPGHRYVYPDSTIMLHLPFGQLQGDTVVIAIKQTEIEKTKARLVAMLRENGVKKTQEQILQDIDREHWMNGKEAIEYGLADKMVEKGVLYE